MLADEHRLQQIFHDLIGNAIKFTKEGSITLSARADQERISVSVSDTGIGIPADKFDTIFKSFEQLEDSDVREQGGTGLGLTVTKQLVEYHGGHIKVSSTLGEGTTFTFDIASTNAKPERVILEAGFVLPQSVHSLSSEVDRSDLPVLGNSEASPHASDSQSSQQATVLVVDDEPINLEVAANHLSLENYKVKTAANGFKALELIENEGKPDLVLLDLMMPGMNGYEVSARLRANYSASELPIILLTAKNQIADLVEGFDSGANDYRVKPFSSRELPARVRSHIKIKSLTQEIISRREERARLERDLEAAKAVQETLLPEQFNIPGVDILTYYQSAERTGGDWYTAHHDPPLNRLYLVVGDVTGHGVPSALVTAVVCGAVQSYLQGNLARKEGEAREVLEDLAAISNDVVMQTGARTDKSMTMALLALDLATGRVDYLSAGQVPLFVIQGGKLRKVVTTGSQLGQGELQYLNRSFELQA